MYLVLFQGVLGYFMGLKKVWLDFPQCESFKIDIVKLER